MTPPALSVQTESRKLTQKEFHPLSDVPSELEWFANLINPKIGFVVNWVRLLSRGFFTRREPWRHERHFHQDMILQLMINLTELDKKNRRNMNP